MKSKNFYSSIIELNLAILFISTSGVLGKYIALPVPSLIFIRSILACLALFIYCKLKRFNFKIPIKDRKKILLGGVLLGAHWMTFFYALKLSNVAIGMLSLYTFPAITALLEPLLTKSKFQNMHLLLGGLVLVGVYLLIPDFDFSSSYFKAICFGVLSAVFYSVRNIMLKPKVKQYNQSVLMFNQLGAISVCLIPTLWLIQGVNLHEFLPYIGLLAILTTAIGHTLFVYSLKHFSTTSASLMSSLQPVYGIILAMIFLNEYPSLTTIVGGLVIISTVVVESLRVKKKGKILQQSLDPVK